eukprot:scaffold13271_cov110-Cylindrotheca_fusiformis.AAC.8
MNIIRYDPFGSFFDDDAFERNLFPRNNNALSSFPMARKRGNLLDCKSMKTRSLTPSQLTCLG